MSNLPSNEFLDPIFEKEDLIKGFKVTWFVINKFFFLSFEISGAFYTLSQNTTWEIGYEIMCTQFHDFTKMSSFSWSFGNS